MLSFKSLCLFLVTTLVAPFALGAKDPNLSRVHLFAIKFTGYKLYEDKNKRSSWDVGTKRTVHEDKTVSCEFLQPLPGTTAAKETWSPVHIYGNVIDEKEKKTPGNKVGEDAVFFDEDSDKRNYFRQKDGTVLTDTFESTLEVTDDVRESMKLEKLSETPNEIQFRVMYQRGKVKFDDIFKLETVPNNAGTCEAAVYFCGEKESEKMCAAKGFERKIDHINMQVDYLGYGADSAKAKIWGAAIAGHLRNDIAAVTAHLKFFDAVAKVFKLVPVLLASK